MRPFGGDELIVDYQDACVYGRDLALLQNPRAWLNDACLHYWMQRVASPSSMLLLDPSVSSFLVHQCHDEEDMDDFIGGHAHLAGIERILVPINDNMHHGAAWQVPGQGTHWSLLVMEIVGGNISVKHLDSVHSSRNRVAAQDVAEQWRKILSKVHSGHIPSVAVKSVTTVQQENDYDCGLHVLVAVEAIVRAPNNVDYEDIVRQAFGQERPAIVCHRLRERMANDILAMAGTNE